MSTAVKVNAELIRRLREQRGWSQEHLAAVSGLSARTVQRLETSGSASKESQLALATTFGVQASELLLDVAAPRVVSAPASGLWSPDRRGNTIVWTIALSMAAMTMMYQLGKDIGDKLNQTCEIPAAERR